MKSRFYFFTAAVMIVAVFSGCKKEEPVAPTIVTKTASDITTVSVQLNAEVINKGSGNVTSCGFYYDTIQSMTYPEVLEGVLNNSTNTFKALVSGLNPSTTYYYRAYAKNNAGLTEGEIMTFTTNDFIPPTIVTSSVSSITPTTATLSGNVTDEGSDHIIEKGFVYGTSATDLSQSVECGDGLGAFSKVITGLSASTTYYFKAYAKSVSGLVYGEQKQFTTQAFRAPTVLTLTETGLSMTGATLNGNITSDGGTTITERGFMYGTSSSNLSQNIQCGSGAGSFIKNLTGLTQKTTYYYKAYATNSIGTSYGEVRSFTTGLRDSRDGNVYAIVTIGNQTWMAENLRYTGNSQMGHTDINNFIDNLTSSSKYRYYPNGNSSNVSTYGYLYNWPAATTACPSGWHLPNNNEWVQLSSALGGNENNVGSQLAGNSSLWQSGNLRNSSQFGSSGFNALPAGYVCHYNNGSSIEFEYNFRQQALFWTATTYSSDNSFAYDRCILYDETELYQRGYSECDYSICIGVGMSVRCVRDSQNNGAVQNTGAGNHLTPVRAIEEPFIKR